MRIYIGISVIFGVFKPNPNKTPMNIKAKLVMLCNCNDLVILKYQVESRYIISAGPGVDLFTWEGIYTYPNYPYIYISHTHLSLSLPPSLSLAFRQALTPTPQYTSALVHWFIYF